MYGNKEMLKSCQLQLFRWGGFIGVTVADIGYNTSGCVHELIGAIFHWKPETITTPNLADEVVSEAWMKMTLDITHIAVATNI